MAVWYTVGRSDKTKARYIKFGNGVEADRLFATTIAQLPGGETILSGIASGGTAALPSPNTANNANVRALKRGRDKMKKSTDVVAEFKLKAAERREAKMSPAEKRLYHLRSEITSAVREYAVYLYGEEASDDNTAKLYRELYKDFAQESGYSPLKSVPFPEIGEYQATKLNSILIDGQGDAFLSMVLSKIRQTRSRLRIVT